MFSDFIKIVNKINSFMNNSKLQIHHVLLIAIAIIITTHVICFILIIIAQKLATKTQTETNNPISTPLKLESVDVPCSPTPTPPNASLSYNKGILLRKNRTSRQSYTRNQRNNEE